MAALLSTAPPELDLTDPEADQPLGDAADLLSRNVRDLAGLDERLANDGAPLSMRLATKLALSKRAVRDLPSGFLSVVFAVYLEHNRMKTREMHPDGEDFLNRKIRQLEWLFGERPDYGWELVVVDDGCPEGSGRQAEEVIEKGRHQDRARVLFLDEAIAENVPVSVGLSSTDESRKGGSILLGMWDAIQTARPQQSVAYTDADLSTHLGQAGLLLATLDSGAACAAGSRREPTSAVVKGGGRNVRGKLFIYLWKQLLAPLDDIVDTQCGFKAFPAGVVGDIVLEGGERRFAFDIELLLRTQLNHGAIAKVPIAWIDSEAQSTTADLAPYLEMLHSIVGMYRRYLPSDPRSDGFAALIDAMDEGAWDRLLENIPLEITEREPVDFATNTGVTAAELSAAAGIELES